MVTQETEKKTLNLLIPYVYKIIQVNIKQTLVPQNYISHLFDFFFEKAQLLINNNDKGIA